MGANRTKSLTEGSPFKLLLGFTLPLLLGMLFQQLYTMIDTVVVGKFLGVAALAGVGSTGPVNFLVLGFCTGICSGFAIPVAQKFGRKDFDGLRRVVGNILWLSLLFAVVITVGVCVFCRQILAAMHTPTDTFHHAYTYIFIIFLGIPSMILYNVLSGIIRSLGNSRIPLYFLIFSSILNIILDLVLILPGQMGVAGAATATVLSQIISGLLCLFYIIRNYPILKLSRNDLHIRRQEAIMLLSMGVPMGLQYTITAVGCMILQSAVNALGSSAMAAITAGGRFQGLLVTPFDAIGAAIATFTGQNVGAGELKRVRHGGRVCFMLGSVYSAIALGLVALWGGDALMMFLDSGEPQTAEILILGKRFLMTNAFFYVPLLLVNLLRFSIQGMGYSNLAIFAGVLELVGRAVVTLLFIPHFGFHAVCFANPAAWVLAILFLIPMYFICLEKLNHKSNAYA